MAREVAVVVKESGICSSQREPLDSLETVEENIIYQ